MYYSSYPVLTEINVAGKFETLFYEIGKFHRSYLSSRFFNSIKYCFHEIHEY